MKVIQGNIDRGREAMDLMYKTAEDERADIMIISEPNRKKAIRGRLHVDKKLDVALVIRNMQQKVRGTGSGDGYIWVELEEVAVFGCYISPNVKCKLM